MFYQKKIVYRLRFGFSTDSSYTKTENIVKTSSSAFNKHDNTKTIKSDAYIYPAFIRTKTIKSDANFYKFIEIKNIKILIGGRLKSNSAFKR